MLACIFFVIPVCQLFLRPKQTTILWDKNEVRVEIEGQLQWSLLWEEFGGGRYSRKLNGYEFLSKSKKPVGLLPNYMSERLKPLRRQVYLSLDEDGEMPEDTYQAKRWSNRTFAIVIANGLVALWLAVSARNEYFRFLREGKDVPVQIAFMLLWFIPGVGLLSAALLRMGFQRSKPRTRQVLEPSLWEEWEDARYIESTYRYSDPEQFRRKCRSDCTRMWACS